MRHPAEVLQDAQARQLDLPVVDHYCGVEARMVKSLALQASMSQRLGVCAFDVTLDCEDGAPAGYEAEHAARVLQLLQSHHAHHPAQNNAVKPRTAVRVHPIDHPGFAGDVHTLVGGAAQLLCHVMLPKVECVQDVETALQAIDAAAGGTAAPVPVHCLIESPRAVHHAFEIAAHPRVASLSFGVMDFVSSHGGAVPDSAMSLEGQLSHPLIVRAKTEISSACHAHGKAPSHSVVTEFKDPSAVERAVRKARADWGYTRQWSIHPDQIQPILAAFAPLASEVARASAIVAAAYAADWAPISHDNTLHDRASYRYYWQVLQKAHRAGQALPPAVAVFF